MSTVNASWWTKIERAEKHLVELKSEIERYTDGQWVRHKDLTPNDLTPEGNLQPYHRSIAPARIVIRHRGE